MKYSIALRYFESNQHSMKHYNVEDNPLNEIFNVLCKFQLEKPQTLYHYVSKDKANYVLKANSDIFCAHTTCQNDPCEICTGCVEFMKYCRKRKLLPQTHIQGLESLLRFDLLSPRLKELPSFNGQCNYPPTMPYIFCATPRDDFPYQWRNYTDKVNGGYCYCFDVDKLCDAIQRRMSKHKDSSLRLAPCLYIGRDDGKIEELFGALVNDFRDAVDEYAETKNPLDPTGACIKLRGAILTIAPLIKHRKWDHEKEWRLILVAGPSFVPEPRLPYKFSESHVPSYLSEICNHPINLMTAIKISPHGDVCELQRYIEDKVKIISDDGNIPIIERSTISESITENYIKLEPDNLNEQYEEYILKQLKEAEVMSQEEFLKH